MCRGLRNKKDNFFSPKVSDIICDILLFLLMYYLCSYICINHYIKFICSRSENQKDMSVDIISCKMLDIISEGISGSRTKVITLSICI